MKSLIKTAAVLLAAFLTLSCNKGGFGEADFVTDVSNVCLIVGGKTIMEYDDAVHQMAWKERDLEFRVMDDSVNDYFTVTISNIPTEAGEQIQAEVVYTTNNNVKTVSGTFNASKITYNSSGYYYWLWNESNEV
ncbi:MAG: hypothetical protein LUC24_01030, partial [Bacteroidales bacterium]|nr:hypothetical protein [Bacteroidales bacterium]